MAAAMKNARVVMPGDIIDNVHNLQASTDKKSKLRLGPGLRQDKDDVVAFKSGILRHRNPATFWIDCSQKRYVPVKEERVIGIITNKTGENFKVDVGTSMAASLSFLAFEGATKRNRPNLQIGDVVYARLSVANKDMEPELDCTDGAGRSTGLGALSGGLLSKDFILLPLLGKYFPFECTVGSNGRVWINSKTSAHIIAISNAITNAEYMTETQIRSMVRQVVEGIM
ncbi:putative exosome complex component rrp40 [Exaiptasia diaphana]|nr:putative exosome complex component rrp40 [Exaiptasia diaphana]